MTFAAWSKSVGMPGERWIGVKSLSETWATCPRGDWLLTLLARLGYSDSRALRLYACWCARRLWRFMNKEASRIAVVTAERFAREEVAAAVLTEAWTAAKDAVDTASRSVEAGARWNELWELHAAQSALWAASQDGPQHKELWDSVCVQIEEQSRLYASSDGAWDTVGGMEHMGGMMSEPRPHAALRRALAASRGAWIAARKAAEQNCAWDSAWATSTNALIAHAMQAADDGGAAAAASRRWTFPEHLSREARIRGFIAAFNPAYVSAWKAASEAFWALQADTLRLLIPASVVATLGEQAGLRAHRWPKWPMPTGGSPFDDD